VQILYCIKLSGTTTAMRTVAMFSIIDVEITFFQVLVYTLTKYDRTKFLMSSSSSLLVTDDKPQATNSFCPAAIILH